MTRWAILGLTLLTGCTGGLGSQNSPSSQVNSCRSNLKNLATACETYAADNGGLYPSNLGKLVGNGFVAYLRSIPTCSAAGKDTYSITYQVTLAPRDKQGKIVSGKDGISFHCEGDHHSAAGLPVNTPAYDSLQSKDR